jgi:hypothetical protein
MLSDRPFTPAGARDIDQFGNQLDEIVFANTRQHFLYVVTLLLFHKKVSSFLDLMRINKFVDSPELPIDLVSVKYYSHRGYC